MIMHARFIVLSDSPQDGTPAVAAPVTSLRKGAAYNAWRIAGDFFL
jgi:hypothetical protein